MLFWMLLWTAQAAPPYGSKEEAVEHMRDHFDSATRVAWAVARGDIDDVHEAAEELDHRTKDVPVTWFGKLDLMRSAARRLQVAKTADGAAARMGTLAESCSYCHQTVSDGPELAPAQQRMTERSPESDHAKSWYYMWLGIGLADDAAWRSGAYAHSAPAHPGTEKLVKQYEKLGQRAREATDAGDRGVIFRQTLGSCARCHAIAGVRLDETFDVGSAINTAPGASGPPAE